MNKETNKKKLRIGGEDIVNLLGAHGQAGGKQ